MVSILLQLQVTTPRIHSLEQLIVSSDSQILLLEYPLQWWRVPNSFTQDLIPATELGIGQLTSPRSSRQCATLHRPNYKAKKLPQASVVTKSLRVRFIDLPHPCSFPAFNNSALRNASINQPQATYLLSSGKPNPVWLPQRTNQSRRAQPTCGFKFHSIHILKHRIYRSSWARAVGFR